MNCITRPNSGPEWWLSAGRQENLSRRLAMAIREERVNATSFKSWLQENGGGFHPQVHFVEVSSGLCITASENIPSDTTIVTCPFELAITQELAQTSLLNFLDLNDVIATNGWTERQWISLYLCFHWIIEESSHLVHRAYLKTLPPREKLRTPLHFTPSEMEMFKGTNLYGAALDRERQWHAEWTLCYAVVERTNLDWGNKFTWESYSTAATYLSSRAFPSTLLSRTPTLQYSPSSQPILLPGIDSLNHARGQPVSWVVSYPDKADINTSKDTPSISLVLHTPAVPGQELLNNYGAKPNSELILGYGFSLPNNPDDTILLKVGGIEGQKWEVGRSANGPGMEGLWNEIVHSIQQDVTSSPTYEDLLDAAGALEDMSQGLIDRLPTGEDKEAAVDVVMRPDVKNMWENYVEGQRDILTSVVEFAHEQERIAVEMARAEGIEIVLED